MSDKQSNHHLGHRRYDPTRRAPLPTHDDHFLSLMDDLTNGLFTTEELEEDPWLPEYVGEVLSRKHAPSERTERVERALATAIAGLTVDELEPNATAAMREKAVLLMADEYLRKSATPNLASDAQKRAKKRRSKVLVKDKAGNEKYPTRAEIPTQKNTFQDAASRAKSPTPNLGPALSRENSFSKSGGAPPRLRSASVGREGGRVSSSNSRRKASTSNEPGIGGPIQFAAYDRANDRRGSSSSDIESDSQYNFASPQSSANGRFNGEPASGMGPRSRSIADEQYNPRGGAPYTGSRGNSFSGGSGTGRNQGYSEYSNLDARQGPPSRRKKSADEAQFYLVDDYGNRGGPYFPPPQSQGGRYPQQPPRGYYDQGGPIQPPLPPNMPYGGPVPGYQYPPAQPGMYDGPSQGFRPHSNPQGYRYHGDPNQPPPPQGRYPPQAMPPPQGRGGPRKF